MQANPNIGTKEWEQQVTFDGNLATIADYEHYTRQVTSPAWFEFEYGTHGDSNWSTYTSNRAAFNALKLCPRVLSGVTDPELEIETLGHTLSFPVLVGPTGLIRPEVDPEGEPGAADAAAKAGTLLVLSAISSFPAKQVAARAGERWWQQVFVYRDRELTEWQVKNAEALGAGAIVLTVTIVAPSFHQVLRFPVPAYGFDPAAVPACFAEYPESGTLSYGALEQQFDPAVAWADVDWLRSLTDLPLVIKGIQCAEDAAECVQHGVNAIVVSNHGGRYVQGARGTVEALPEIVEAAGDRLDVYLDGGIRQGQDVLKALALGAKAVWVGRAARWGQTVAGPDGVGAVLGILRSELRDMMIQCGVSTVEGVDPQLISTSAVPTLEH